MEAELTDPRLERGVALVRGKGSAIRTIMPGKYFVPSASHSGGYVVAVDALGHTCTCPDWTDHGASGHAYRCKHIYAVLVVTREIDSPDSSRVVVEEKARGVYPRDWRATNRALVDIKFVGPALIADLVSGVALVGPTGRRGRPHVETRHIVHGLLLKTFDNLPARSTVEAM